MWRSLWLLIVLVGCNEEFVIPENCIDENKIIPYKDRVCTMEVDYVCGCNGVLYINSCHAEAEGVTDFWSATLIANCKS